MAATGCNIVPFPSNDNVGYWTDEEWQLKQTLTEVESLWSADKDNIMILSWWIKAMHNMADYYQKQSRFSKTFYYLVTPHNWLINQLHREDKTQDEIDLIIHMMQTTFKPLYDFSLVQPCCDKCRNNLEETRLMLKQRSKTLH